MLRILSSTVIAAVVFGATAAAAAPCYRLPFSNPNLADGFGSTKGRAHPHRGVDFPQPRGKAIPAVASGTVAVVTRSSCLGNVIVIKHADGKYSGYSHMQSRASLKVGNKVTRGQTVGKVGATGTCAFGAHLHLTMSPVKGGWAAGTVIDPYKWIKNHKCQAMIADFDANEADAVTDEEIAQLEEAEMAEIIAGADAADILDDDVPSSPDEDVEDDGTDGELAEGGCATRGGTGLGGGALLLLALALTRRRRR